MLPARTVSAGGHDGVLVDQVDHSDKKFSEYNYEHMDEKDFDAIIAPLDDIKDDTSKADEVLQLIIDMEDYCNLLQGNGTLAHIYSDLVADDAHWDDETKYTSELYTNVIDKVWQCTVPLPIPPTAMCCMSVSMIRMTGRISWITRT